MSINQKEGQRSPYVRPVAECLQLLRGLSLLSELSIESGENTILDHIEDEGEL